MGGLLRDNVGSVIRLFLRSLVVDVYVCAFVCGICVCCTHDYRYGRKANGGKWLRLLIRLFLRF